jgi:replicative DNA helicase
MDLEYTAIRNFVNVNDLQYLWDKGIRSEHFFDNSIREIYNFSLDYLIKSEFKSAPTENLLRIKFGSYLNSVGWPSEEYLVHIITDDLLEKYRRVNVQKILLESANILDDDPGKAINLAISKLTKVQEDTATRERIEVYKDGFQHRVDEYIDSTIDLEKSKKRKGIYFGWDLINDQIYGIHPGELAVIAGYAGIGKSLTGAKLALEAARRGTKVYLFNLELDKELELKRLDCLASGVSFTKYERGELNSLELERLVNARAQIESFGHNLLIDTPSYASERTVQDLYSRAKLWGAELVIGDQLSWLTPEGNYKGSNNIQTAQMSELIVDITRINKEMNLASIWLVQFNRDSQSTSKQRGGLQHIALSSQIEQNVSIAMGISATQEMMRQEIKVFEILKSRRSSLKSYLMEYAMDDKTSIEVIKELNTDVDSPDDEG